jgi:hypothetical protein
MAQREIEIHITNQAGEHDDRTNRRLRPTLRHPEDQLPVVHVPTPVRSDREPGPQHLDLLIGES